MIELGGGSKNRILGQTRNFELTVKADHIILVISGLGLFCDYLFTAHIFKNICKIRFTNELFQRLLKSQLIYCLLIPSLSGYDCIPRVLIVTPVVYPHLVDSTGK